MYQPNSVPPVPFPLNEAERLEALVWSRLLDTPPEAVFDNLTALASEVFRAPIVLISLVDQHRDFFKSAVGTSLRAINRDVSFSAHALLGDTLLTVPDTFADERFRNNPLVTGDPGIRSFAAALLIGKGGHKLGAFCILEQQPRAEFAPDFCIELQRFAHLTSNLIEQRRLERELCDANDRFVLATKASRDGIFDLHYLSGEMHCSARWNHMLGLPAVDSRGRLEDWIDRVHPDFLERVLALWADIVRNQELSVDIEFRCRHEDGSWRWLMTQLFCQRGPSGELERVTGSCRDITAARMIDPLTALHNRTSLLEHLQWRIDRQVDHPRGYGLLFVDLDGFKRVNDSLGHRRGDALLVEVARRLERTVQGAPGSLVSRLGGDEFVILINEVEAAEDVLTYASMLEYLLATPVDCDGQQVFITASVGVVFGGLSDYTRAEQALEDADVAMYRAKLHGKAQNAIFSEKMREDARARLLLESELRTALERDELEVWYQPKVRLSSNEIRGFEALLRWRHPRRGLVSPVEFIPVAEEIGLICGMGRWVTSQAIAQLADWRGKNLVSLEATMAVNVSPRQFKEPDLLPSMTAQLSKRCVPFPCFIVEVTETGLVEDTPALLALLQSIVSVGIGLDLDDFGTGYSSLSYLHRFPFRSVKIDRSFVGRMNTDPGSVMLVASIISLAASMKMGVIAEGVENEGQVKYLTDMGCNCAQGFLFSPPRPAQEIERYLRERTPSFPGLDTPEVFALPPVYGQSPAEVFTKMM